MPNTITLTLNRVTPKTPLTQAAVLVLSLCALALPARAATQWNEITAPPVSTISCITRNPEMLGSASVAWRGDPLAPPQINTVYYSRVRWGVTGKPCIGGANVAPELFLPDGTTLAISTANPVRCTAVNLTTGARTSETTQCPIASKPGQHGGSGFFPTQQATWPTPQGTGWEIEVPLISTMPLAGVVTSTNPTVPCPDCLTASVLFDDGVFVPESFPRVGVRIAGPMTPPTITYPTPSATNLTATSATGQAILNRAGTTGQAFVQDSLTPPSTSTCQATSMNASVTSQSPASITFTPTFSALTPGTIVFWRLCYTTTTGTTIIGATQSFRTTGTAPPQILSVTPGAALPGRTVTITGTNLAGATAVSLIPPGRPSRFGPIMSTPIPAFVVASTATSVTFTVPNVGTTVAIVSVTTPGGTANSSTWFTVGIDTILDDVNIAARNGGSFVNDAVIRFHATEPIPFAEFDCRLDSLPLASTCSGGLVQYDDLAPGRHSVEISAHSGGFRDISPLIVIFDVFNVDSTPPDTNLLTGPASGGYITANSATFTFTSSESGSVFECNVDGNYAWTACTSPFTLTGLAEGPHTFAVRAKDAAFNVDPTPASTSFTVDTVAPETQLTPILPEPGVSVTTSPTASFSFSTPATDLYVFQCSFDGGPWTQCQSPMTYLNLAAGPHSFQVRAVDRAGNADPTPAATSWLIQQFRAR